MKRALSGSLGQEISRTFQLCVLSWLLWLGWIWMFCLMFDLKILPEARWKFLLQDTSQVFSRGCWVVWNTLLAMEGNFMTCILLTFLLGWNPVLSCSVLYLCYDPNWSSFLPYTRLWSPESSSWILACWDHVTIMCCGQHLTPEDW